MRIYNQKKTSAKIVQKSDLGGSWAPFGKGLGRSGASWGHFWAHFDCLLDVPNHIFLKQWAKMGSKRLFGWLLDRFWEGLGRIWMRLGRIWAFKIKAFASHGHFLNTLGVPCCLTLCYRNPRVASLRLAERHDFFLRCLAAKFSMVWPLFSHRGRNIYFKNQPESGSRAFLISEGP